MPSGTANATWHGRWVALKASESADQFKAADRRTVTEQKPGKSMTKFARLLADLKELREKEPDFRAVVFTKFDEVQKALKGLSVMSSEIEGVYQSMFNNKIPALWLNKSYPSLKPLSSYFSNLLERLSMLSTWMENGAPVMFNLSNFFFTQAFLTGSMQNYARRNSVAIDSIEFQFSVLPTDPTEAPENGVYVYGLFLEGFKLI